MRNAGARVRADGVRCGPSAALLGGAAASTDQGLVQARSMTRGCRGDRTRGRARWAARQGRQVPAGQGFRRPPRPPGGGGAPLPPGSASSPDSTTATATDRAHLGRLHRELICRPGRVIRHARRTILRLPPGTIGLVQVTVRGPGQQDDAVGLQDVQGVLGLADRAVHVGQGQGREEAETGGPVGDDTGAVLVEVAGQGPGLPVIPEPGARRQDGQDAGRDPVAVHESQRLLCRPFRDRDAAGTFAGTLEEAAVAGRQDVVVHVDALRRGWHQIASTAGRTRRSTRPSCLRRAPVSAVASSLAPKTNLSGRSTMRSPTVPWGRLPGAKTVANVAST